MAIENTVIVKIQAEKPPLGIIPHRYWVEDRIREIYQAIIRYHTVNKTVPNEWLEELITLQKEISELKNG